MKKLFIAMLIALMSFSMSSCVTASAQYTDDVYTEVVETGENYTTIVTYGTPYYYDGVISYYLYRGVYYYPYFWHDCWYFHPFHHVRPAGYRFYPPRHHKPHVHLMDPHRGHNPHFGNPRPQRFGGPDRMPNKPRIDRPSLPTRPQVNRPSVNRPTVTRPQVNRPTMTRPQVSRPQMSRPQTPMRSSTRVTGRR